MNLDELVNIGNQASDDVAARAERMGLCPSGLDMGRARVRAIVTALRDELLPPHIRIVVSGQLLKTNVREVFNQILGSNAGAEKVAVTEHSSATQPDADKSTPIGLDPSDGCEECEDELEDAHAHLCECFEETGKILCESCWEEWLEENEL